MKKRKRCSRVRFWGVLCAVVGVLLCATPCIGAIDVWPGETLDIETTVVGPLTMHGNATVNLKEGGYVTWGLYTDAESTLNITGGGVQWWISVIAGANVTVFGTDFVVTNGTIDPSESYFTIDDIYQLATLTGTYGSGSGINLPFCSDLGVPIHLAEPAGPSGVEKVGEETLVNTTRSGDQKGASVAMADDGSFIAVWEGPDSDKKGVFAQRFNANGSTNGGEFLVNTYEIGDQKKARAAVASDGSFVVVWEGQDEDKKGIFGQFFDANGSTNGGEFQVNTTTAGDQKEPSMAMVADDGSFIVVWEGRDLDKKGVFAQRFNGNGSLNGAEFLVNTYEVGDQKKPSVAVAGDGSFVIVWEGRDADRKGVFGQLFNADGSANGGEFQINTITSGDQKEPSVAMAGDGSFIAAWEGPDADRKGVFAQRFNSDGSLNGAEFQVNTSTKGDQKKPEVAIGDASGFVIVWEGLDTDKKGIFAQCYDTDGSPVESEFQVNTTTAGDQKEASVVMIGDGRFTVAWEGPDGDKKGVFIQCYDLN